MRRFRGSILPVITQDWSSIFCIIKGNMRSLWNIAVVLVTIMIVSSRPVASEITTANTTSPTARSTNTPSRAAPRISHIAIMITTWMHLIKSVMDPSFLLFRVPQVPITQCSPSAATAAAGLLEAVVVHVEGAGRRHGVGLALLLPLLPLLSRRGRLLPCFPILVGPLRRLSRRGNGLGGRPTTPLLEILVHLLVLLILLVVLLAVLLGGALPVGLRAGSGPSPRQGQPAVRLLVLDLFPHLPPESPPPSKAISGESEGERSGRAMALEWVVLGYAAGAEAIMLLLLTLPGLDALRRGMISVVRSALKPMMSVVPFCLFLLMDIYWKYEMRPTCDDEHACTPSEHLRHQKSIMKSQRNALLIAAALLLYWILFSVTSLVVKLDHLQQRVDKLKKRDD